MAAIRIAVRLATSENVRLHGGLLEDAAYIEQQQPDGSWRQLGAIPRSQWEEIGHALWALSVRRYEPYYEVAE